MKNLIIKISTAFVLLLFVAGCDKWTDIEPKGMNMLQKVSDIDMLLNYEFRNTSFMFQNGSVVVNDLLPGLNVIYSVITDTANNPVRRALYTWDESIDREKATETDDVYTDYYGVIGKVCNPVLLRADDAEGDRDLANRYKAEAYVLRAWYHYLLVNIYAKAYDPATAAEDGGIPYSRESDLLSVPNEKRTVQEVYELILEDLESAFDLNSLAAPSANRMRVNSAFAYAVKAKVLMSMRDYDGASQAAASALSIENTVDDHNKMLALNPAKYISIDYSKLPEIVYVFQPGYSFIRPEMSSRQDLFYTSAELVFRGLTPEFKASIEPGNIFFNHIGLLDPSYASMYYGINTDVLVDIDARLNPGGLSTVDMYLIQAECLIRKGDAAGISNAMDIINNIRRNRIATAEYAAAGSNSQDMIDPAYYYTPLSASTTAEAITHLKQVDRSENWLGPKRFINVKRWNTEEGWKETLNKHVDCITDTGIASFDFSVSPDSPIWIFPFPSKSTGLNGNLTQNY